MTAYVPSSKGLVLVTGANGYIAQRVVEAFLLAGYSVRGTVRSLASGQPLLAALPAYAAEPGRLTFAEVPDIVAEGAFDDAVKGVVAIAHLASPMSLAPTDPEPVIRTAVGATVGVLQSAAKEAGVKSVVLMSSFLAVRGTKPEGQPAVYTEADWNEWAEPMVAKLGKNTPGLVTYIASKVAAERAFWRFRTEHAPRFTMTAVNPVLVAGPPLALPQTPEKIGLTAKFVWQVLSGEEIPPPLPNAMAYVDVGDVARIVVWGVEHAEQADGERYIAAASQAPPQAAADVLRRVYPERKDIIKTGTPGAGYREGYAFPEDDVIDSSKAEKATGQGYIGYEKMVIDTAKAFEAYL